MNITIKGKSGGDKDPEARDGLGNPNLFATRPNNEEKQPRRAFIVLGCADIRSGQIGIAECRLLQILSEAILKVYC